MRRKDSEKTRRIYTSHTVMVFLVLISGPICFAQTNHEMQSSATIHQAAADLLAGFSKGVAYSGFRHGQHPDRGDGAANPSDMEILDDLKTLARNSNFGLIRLYDSQANSAATLRLIRANKIKLKVMLGAWLSAEVSNPHCPWLPTPIPQATLDANKIKNQKEIERAIRLAKEYPSIVVAVNVGNEILVDWNDHMVSLEALISYVRQVKHAIRQPVTVADNYAWWAKNGLPLAKEIDFVTVHTYPEWENKDIDEALSYSIGNIQGVHATLPQSRIVIGEAGWATVASEFGKRASEENQKRYVNELTAWATRNNITAFIFEAFDEDWKGETSDALGAEKHWGLFTVDRKAKLAMHELYPDLVAARAKE
jgi:exo-beta-1,3-glucanase (GH17 family)